MHACILVMLLMQETAAGSYAYTVQVCVTAVAAKALVVKYTFLRDNTISSNVRRIFLFIYCDQDLQHNTDSETISSNVVSMHQPA